MQILDFIDKTITEFSGKRVAILFGILALGVIAIVSYELTTSKFRLDKYQQAAELLSTLGPLLDSSNESVRLSAQEMTEDVKAILLEGISTQSGLSPEEHRRALVLLMSMPWIIFSLIGIVELFQGVKDWAHSLLGCLFLAFVFGFASYYVPPDLHWFYRYLVIPFLTYGVTLSAFYVLSNDDEEETA